MPQSTSSDLFERIGKDKRCYKFAQENAQEFATWFKDTKYFQEEEALGIKGMRKRIPRWGVRHNASGWEYFIEGADRVSGEPKVICTRCDAILAHPVKNGTSGMTEHPTTKGCEATSKARGLRQLVLSEGYMAGVLPEILPENASTNILVEKERDAGADFCWSYRAYCRKL
jgi:hypothetical protein